MRLRLTIREPAHAEQPEHLIDIELTADATATVADIAACLHERSPFRRPSAAAGDDGSDVPRGADPTPPRFTLEVQGPGVGDQPRLLAPEADLIAAELHAGSTVTVRPLRARRLRSQRAVAVVRVLSGPDQGTEHPLPLGSSLIGRSRDAEVRLTDPQVSVRHCRVSVGERIEVIDLRSDGGVDVSGRAVQRCELTSFDQVRIGETTLSVTPLDRVREETASSPVIAFTRSPRVIPRLPERPLQAPQPPRRLSPPAFPLYILAAPLLMGALMYAITGSLHSMLFMLLMPIMAIGAHQHQRRQQRRAQRIQSAEFDEAMQALARRAETAHDIERAVRRAQTPSAVEALDAVARRSRLLWTHRPEHPAFATLSLGTGRAPSRIEVQMPRDHEAAPDAWERLEDTCELIRGIDEVPLVAALRTDGSVAVAGGDAAGGVLRALVLQVAGLHSPAEVQIAAICALPVSGISSMTWLKWLPHTCAPQAALPGEHLADDAAGAADLLARIEGLIAARESRAAGSTAATASSTASDPSAAPQDAAGLPDLVLPLLVLVVQDDAACSRSRLIRVAERGPAVGVHVLWHASELSRVPAACRAYIAIDAAHGSPRESGTTVPGLIGLVCAGERPAPVALEHVSAEEAGRSARALAPVVDIGAAMTDDSDLPQTISWLQLAGPSLGEDPRAVLASWESAPVAALPAIVGHDGHQALSLDLVSQGPHALVGGTTGAGKSEFLQSWVLGMAAAHSPERVTFLFVDYKGGSAFADAVELPHAVGLVTDLSAHLVRRALTSLRAELRWREDLLHRCRAKDIEALEASGDIRCPPRLVIVVDEFAALAAEIPAFVDGVVDIAARGRSLGLHLILATQRPAGVIRENLRANTNLRVALRLADEHDSRDILGDPLAARVDPSLPGRAAVRSGPGAITVFQAAYAGGLGAAGVPGTGIDIHERPFGAGRRWEPPAPAPVALQQQEPEVCRIVTTLRRASRLVGIEEPRRPWLPELPTAVDLGTLLGKAENPSGGPGPLAPPVHGIVLGIADVPECQEQPSIRYRPDEDGALAVLGAGGTGRSTTLRTLAISAILAGEDIEIHAIDASGAGLAMLSPLPQVGSVIESEDEERVIRLLRRLLQMLDTRTDEFSRLRVANLSEHRARSSGGPGSEAPRVLLLLDGIGAFREHWDGPRRSRWLAALIRIASEGRACGIHLAFTADRPASIPPALAAAVRHRVVHRMASTDDAAALGVPRGLLPADCPPGRAVREGHEMQVAVLGGSADLALQSRCIEELAALQERGGARVAPAVARLPERVLAGPWTDRAGLPLLGRAEDTLEPIGFTPRGGMLVAGPLGSGRRTALSTMAQSLSRLKDPPRLIRLSARSGELSALPLWDARAEGPEAVRIACAELIEALGEDRSLPGRLALVIEGVSDLVEAGLGPLLERVVRTALSAGQLVIAENETSAWSQALSILRPLRSARRGLILQPGDGDGELLLGTALGVLPAIAMPPGRGVLVDRGAPRLLQVALSAPPAAPPPTPGPGRPTTDSPPKNPPPEEST